MGTQKWLSPQIFSELHQKNVPIGVSADLWGFNVPFNRLSRFRDPGRININTIPDQTVWNAIDPEPNQSASWGGNGVERSLIGGSDSDRPKRPAFYANPVRSASSADLMPLDDLKQAPVEATLLRSGGSNRPLFDFSTGAAYANPDSNPYFRYHKLQRLGNLLTTHSNVYAVWITVGYFEVLPWPDPNGFATPDTMPRTRTGFSWDRKWVVTPDRSSGTGRSTSSIVRFPWRLSQARITTSTAPSCCGG